MSDPQHNPEQTPSPQQARQASSPPGQPYSPPGQPYSAPGDRSPYAQAPGRPNGRGTLGRTAFLLAAASVAFGLVMQLILPFFYASVGFSLVDVLSNLVNLVVLVGAAAGSVLGILALRRPAPHLLAAIAIGVGGSTVIGTIVAWVANLFYFIGL